MEAMSDVEAIMGGLVVIAIIVAAVVIIVNMMR